MDYFLAYSLGKLFFSIKIFQTRSEDSQKFNQQK